jgi:hypothetical protein
MDNTNQFDPFTEFISLEDFAACDPELRHILIFESFDEASSYHQEHAIDGRCVELPLY